MIHAFCLNLLKMFYPFVCGRCDEIMLFFKQFLVRDNRLYHGYWCCPSCGRVSVTGG